MNLITRATVGALVGYAVGKTIDYVTAPTKADNRQPIEKAACLPLFKLANDNSVGWFQCKLQDALDMLDTGAHRPVKRVVVTNAMARDFRARALRELPHRNENGNMCHGVGLTISELLIDVTDTELNATYCLNVCVEFKKLGGTIVPAAHLHDADGMLDERWYSYADAFEAMHSATAKAIRIAGCTGAMVTTKAAKEMYESGKELGKAQAQAKRPAPVAPVPEYIKKAPTVSMSELERECEDRKDDDDEFM